MDQDAFNTLDSEYDIADWWETTTKDDLAEYQRKNAEYGDADLSVIGGSLSLMAGNPKDVEWSDEIGIAFYLLGKVSRMISAYKEGSTPSDDTLKDIAIYAMMARLHRERKLRRSDAWFIQMNEKTSNGKTV